MGCSQSKIDQSLNFLDEKLQLQIKNLIQQSNEFQDQMSRSEYFLTSSQTQNSWIQKLFDLASSYTHFEQKTMNKCLNKIKSCIANKEYKDIYAQIKQILSLKIFSDEDVCTQIGQTDFCDNLQKYIECLEYFQYFVFGIQFVYNLTTTLYELYNSNQLTWLQKIKIFLQKTWNQVKKFICNNLISKIAQFTVALLGGNLIAGALVYGTSILINYFVNQHMSERLSQKLFDKIARDNSLDAPYAILELTEDDSMQTVQQQYQAKILLQNDLIKRTTNQNLIEQYEEKIVTLTICFFLVRADKLAARNNTQS
ncbi:hypothetical protein ABPG74_005320 [Tetrahymena malaccensis]